MQHIVKPVAGEKRPHPLLHLICGSLAGCTATILTYPLDLVRARMASQVTKTPNFVNSRGSHKYISEFVARASAYETTRRIPGMV